MTHIKLPYCPLETNGPCKAMARVRFFPTACSTIFVAIALTLACATPSLADDVTLDQLRQENVTLRARVRKLQMQVKNLTEKVEALQSQKQQAETHAQGLVARHRAVAAEAEAHFVTCGHEADSGVTTCRTKWMPLMVTHGRKRHHWFRLVHAHSGNDAPESERHVTVEFKTRASGGIYRSVSSLRLDLDGESITRPIQDYQALRRSGSGSRTKLRRDNESFTAALSVEDLSRVVQGSSVEGRLGAVRFDISADQIHACKVMLRKIRQPARSTGDARLRGVAQSLHSRS